MSHMTPEIAARWQRSYDRWEREASYLPSPERFEVPDDKYDIVADVWFGSAYIDEKRFYADPIGSWRYKLILLEGVFLWAGISMIAISFTKIDVSFLGIHEWLWALLFFALRRWVKRAQERVARKGTFVFERETGKLYIPVRGKRPHYVVDFYDQHFLIKEGYIGYNKYGAVELYLPHKKYEDGTARWPELLRLAFMHDRADAEEAWRFLVRYMDKSWPFDEDELKYFESVAEEKRKMGYKVEDIRRVRGEREFF